MAKHQDTVVGEISLGSPTKLSPEDASASEEDASKSCVLLEIEGKLFAPWGAEPDSMGNCLNY